jgi:hypothetical protein
MEGKKEESRPALPGPIPDPLAIQRPALLAIQQCTRLLETVRRDILRELGQHYRLYPDGLVFYEGRHRMHILDIMTGATVEYGQVKIIYIVERTETPGEHFYFVEDTVTDLVNNKPLIK